MTDVQFNRISKALADPQRFAMLRRIAGSKKEPACMDLAREFDVTPATVSHHLKELSTAGLVEGRKEGQCMYLSANSDVLEAYLREVSRRLLPGFGSKGP
ncbi:MAG TPA: metalloregulator ArsR/SmtB family transcription factor [Tepidisphaeraceae bacterium]|nr:metalloregulator ArsR/SmtB family transcription factor [Tepidisphaeraceae bacterium]